MTPTQAALIREYRRGLIDGYETTLRLLLGQPDSDGVPYTGPALPPEAEAWARQALARIEAAK